jgi:hypothetical protein
VEYKEDLVLGTIFEAAIEITQGLITTVEVDARLRKDLTINPRL